MKKNKSRFWLIYGICTGTAVVAIAVFLIVFNSIIASYEVSQPHTAVEEYISSLSKDSFTQMAGEAIDELQMKYESREDYTAYLSNAFDGEKLSYRKYLPEATVDNPVFSVLSGDTELIRLRLKRGADGAFGFERWTAESAYIPLDGVLSDAGEYTVYAPVGCELKVNGFTPEIKEKGLQYPIFGELEKTELPQCDLYELGVLYSKPEFECLVGDKKCVSLERDGKIFFFAEGSAPQSYTVSAPEGAEVYVNGIALREEYITERGKTYEYSPLEVNKDDLPTYTVYSTGELFASPTVSATLEGIELSAVAEGAVCAFKYPEEKLYELTVKAPKGAQVTVGDVLIGELATPSAEAVFEELIVNADALPMLDVYTFTGLYTREHQVKVSYSGKELEVKSIMDGTDACYYAEYPAAENGQVSAFAVDFVKAYFNYTSKGYSGIDENLEAALGFVSEGSDLYKKIKNSKIGYEYVTPVSSQEYRTLLVSEMMLLSDGTYAVQLDFDVLQRISYVERIYKGKLSLLIDSETMKIVNMVIENE